MPSGASGEPNRPGNISEIATFLGKTTDGFHYISNKSTGIRVLLKCLRRQGLNKFKKVALPQALLKTDVHDSHGVQSRCGDASRCNKLGALNAASGFSYKVRPYKQKCVRQDWMVTSHPQLPLSACSSQDTVTKTLICVLCPICSVEARSMR